MPYRVFIVDDVLAVCEALRWVFEDTPDLVVVGEAQDGQTAIKHATRLAPDIVILDIELPKGDGFMVARQLKRLTPPPRIIFLTVHGDVVSRRRAREAGGDGFVEKGAGWPALLGQIRHLLDNEP